MDPVTDKRHSAIAVPAVPRRRFVVVTWRLCARCGERFDVEESRDTKYCRDQACRLARRRERRAAAKVRATSTCAYCEYEFTRGRVDQRYCSGRCRVRAFRETASRSVVAPAAPNHQAVTTSSPTAAPKKRRSRPSSTPRPSVEAPRGPSGEVDSGPSDHKAVTSGPEPPVPGLRLSARGTTTTTWLGTMPDIAVGDAKATLGRLRRLMPAITQAGLQLQIQHEPKALVKDGYRWHGAGWRVARPFLGFVTDVGTDLTDDEVLAFLRYLIAHPDVEWMK